MGPVFIYFLIKISLREAFRDFAAMLTPWAPARLREAQGDFSAFSVGCVRPLFASGFRVWRSRGRARKPEKPLRESAIRAGMCLKAKKRSAAEMGTSFSGVSVNLSLVVLGGTLAPSLTRRIGIGPQC